MTDHQPIVKLFGDRTLDEISNTRLFKLKQRVLPWRFDVMYMPGKGNHFADATSRNPIHNDEDEVSFSDSIAALRMSEDDLDHDDEDEAMEESIAAIGRSGLDKVGVVNWEMVRNHSEQDQTLSDLAQFILEGFPDRKSKLPEQLWEFWDYRESLSMVDGVILCGQKIVIPVKLQPDILEILSSAHQGEVAM